MCREYVNANDDYCFIKKADLFFINAGVVSPVIECSFCNQKLRSTDGVPCFCCGKAYHHKCGQLNNLLISIPGLFSVCSSCYYSNGTSLQLVFLKNMVAGCNHLCKINPLAFYAKEFQLLILEDLRKANGISESAYFEDVTGVYQRFYKKGAFVWL